MKLESSYVKSIVVHCSATKPNQNIGAAEIRAWHLERGWDDIGYHFVIKRDGVVEIGRPLDVIGAHVKGHNSTSIGICMVGGLNDDGTPGPDYTAEQWQSLVSFAVFIEKIFPHAGFCGHRDLYSGKDCPSFDVKDFFKGLEYGWSL